MTSIGTTPTPSSQLLASSLGDYFEHNTDVFRTPAAPQHKYSQCWNNLLKMLFVMDSLSPDPVSPSLFTQVIKLKDPQAKWEILPNGAYSVSKLAMTTVAYSPPKPGTQPSPKNKLEGEVQLGQRTQKVEIPLGDGTSYTHDVGSFTIGQVLDAFGGMRAGVGTLASSTLPCPISGVGALVVSAVNGGGAATINVDFGAEPAVTCKLAFASAVDPEHGGVLRAMSLSATAEGEWNIELDGVYYEVPFHLTYPYDQLQCVERDPTDPPPDDHVINALKQLLEVTVGVVNWVSVCTYARHWFSNITPSVIESVGVDVARAAVAASVPLSLDQLAGGLEGAFQQEVAENPEPLARALNKSALDGANSLTKVAQAMRSANPQYTASKIAQGLESAFQQTKAPLEIAEVLVDEFGYQGDAAGVKNLFEALAGGKVSTDLVTLGTVARSIWTAVTPTEFASGLTATFGIAPAAAATVPGLTPLTGVQVAKAVIEVFTSGRNEFLGRDAVAIALANAGFGARQVGQGLAPLFTPLAQWTCQNYVDDLVGAFRQKRTEPAVVQGIAYACHDTGYDKLFAGKAMAAPPASYFDPFAAKAALENAYGSPIGCVLNLNGGSMTIPGNYGFGGNAPFTIEVQIQGGVEPRQTVRIFSQETPEKSKGYALYVSRDGLTFQVYDKGAGVTWCWIGSDMPPYDFYQDGKPHNIAFVYPGATGMNQGLGFYKEYARFGVQGNAWGDGWKPGTTNPPNVANDGPMVVGGADAVANGQLSALKLRLWSRALSQDDIQRNVTGAGPDTAGTIGFWDFTTGNINDRSPKNAQVQLIGGAAIMPVFMAPMAAIPRSS